ncbi:hypothetical protein [Sphingomonas sp. LY160]|uniref:hypothetical protein n=1 Tax=Sphingomonas sp. LY160 TaxID=3095342 RepID=UPI002ADEEC06|nr:hypothetical protein [Sphingomonas sp. LY160]MEA1072867.1 hypothetical protein [Sphingomonas sp. LY160]
MINSKIAQYLMVGAAAVALAGCGGADDVASPGEGVIVVPSPTPTPTPGTGTPTPTPGTAAPSCPTGTADVGTIAVGTAGNDSRRVCQVSGTIRGNLRLQNLAGTIYSLSGKVQVGDDQGADPSAPAAGAQSGILTLDAGVTVFGASGADFLVVNRGSQLIADGTATRPVVMTSRGNVVGTSSADSIGEWGGLVVLGRAPIGDCADAGATGGTIQCQAPVEGTSGSIYGGASPNDNSGRLSFLQVRYPGFRVDTNNELNGITLGGVGAGTIINNVQVHNSSDDGIEWFGGRVNQKYLVLTGNDDDSLDVDSGYKGATQFAIVTQRSGGGDKFIEGDSTDKPVNAVPRTDFLLSNFTFVSSRAQPYIHLRGGMDAALYNGVVSAPVCLDVDTAETIQATGTDEKGVPRFNSLFFACATPFLDDTDVTAAQIAAIFNAGANNVSNGTSTLTGTFINGANENGRPFTSPTALSSSFVTVNYIGAVRDANDNWWRGWTCGTATNEASCLSVPAAG